MKQKQFRTTQDEVYRYKKDYRRYRLFVVAYTCGIASAFIILTLVMAGGW